MSPMCCQCLLLGFVREFVMGTRLDNAESRSTFSDAQSCRDDLAGDFGGTIAPDHVWFALMAKRVWPIKANAAIMQFAKCADRTARAYTSADRIPSATVLRDLLGGDEGGRVLNKLWDTPPEWRRHELALMELGREFAAFIKAKIKQADEDLG